MASVSREISAFVKSFSSARGGGGGGGGELAVAMKMQWYRTSGLGEDGAIRHPYVPVVTSHR